VAVSVGPTARGGSRAADAAASLAAAAPVAAAPVAAATGRPPTALAVGAEAVIVAGAWRGRAVVEKRRLAKAYRHAALDTRLRAERTRDEANLLLAARAAGVPVPIVYDVDRATATLRLEHVDGVALRHVLDDDAPAVAAARMRKLGEFVGRLHGAGLTHGDLTTSNVLVRGGGSTDRPDDLVLLDFGLGQASQEAEDHAVDLHVIEEALTATHAGADAMMAAVLAGYAHAAPQRIAAAALRRLEAVRERGRYRGAA
jgi:Kae1-associated kinase Bud32